MGFQITSFDGAIQWLLFNVFLALFPLGVNFVAVKIYGSGTTWMHLLKEGELFIYSSTVSASYIGVDLFRAGSTNSANSYTAVGLIFVLVTSTALFTLSNWLKFHNQTLPAVNVKLVSVSSIGCALLAVALSFYISLS